MPKNSSAYYALQVRTADASSIRYLYLKSHTDFSEKVGAPLFVAGLGVSYDESVLTELFEIFGAVSQVALHQDKTSALVVFASPSSLKKALRTAAESKALTVAFKEPTETFGLKDWVEQHKAKTPGNRVLQQQLDEWMAQWEAQESQRQAAAATDAADEGWTVVTKQRGRKKNTDSGGTSVGSVAGAVAAAAKSRKSPKQLLDFYRFQARDRRRDNVLELQQQFEQDKKKIAEWKASRRFKPY
ncbi:hypothetical protein WJX79_005065 [Trebouxia sp. C0005]|nr:MAG: ribosomal RNA-processing 7 protein A-like isoform 1 [Trebouxia sp. A1-2]